MTLSIHAAATQIRAGKLTPEQLLDQILERIDRLEVRVRAWVLVDRDQARRQAQQASRELAAGADRGPLHGIPLGVKDIFDVAGWPTSAGSLHWYDSKPRQDATVVARLRAAGAVFVGKTVTTPYASFDPPPTRNPWNLERTPGGSSSGSAAALACGMCLGALASQTGGSITRPAAFCGVVGCKPSLYRVSAHGVVPLAYSMDHPGVLANCVRDAALLLQTIAGPDPADPPTLALPWPERYAAAEGNTLKPARFLRLKRFFEEKADPAMHQLMDQVTERFSAAGAPSADVAVPALFTEVTPRHRTIMAVEAAAFHEARLRKVPYDYGPSICTLLEEGLRCPAVEYQRSQDHRTRLIREMDSLIGDEILLTPAALGTAPAAATTGDPVFNSPFSYLGYPTVCLPAGWSPDGLPLAIQLAARRGSEGRLLEVAGWCEEKLEFVGRQVS